MTTTVSTSVVQAPDIDPEGSGSRRIAGRGDGIGSAAPTADRIGRVRR